MLRIDVPDVRGDQLIFYYDAREGRVSFLTVNNPAPSGSVVVEVAFYSIDLANVVGSDQIEIPAAGTTIIDPSSSAGVAGNRGLAVVTPIDTDGKAIVPPVPLSGNFTLANLQNAAFGENAMGRRAVFGDGTRATAGDHVDNTGDAPVRYQQFAPTILTIPSYFDPRNLAPAADDGNRVIVAAFNDVYGDVFRIAARDPALPVTVRLCDGGNGTLLAETELNVDGVAVTDLQALAGGVALVSAGSAYFSPEPLGSNNFFGIFSQSLGTFGAGQRMPSLGQEPACLGTAPPPSPSPPTPTPVPICGNDKREGSEECDGTDFSADGEASVGVQDSCDDLVGSGGVFAACSTGEVSCNNCQRRVTCCCPCAGAAYCRGAEGFSCESNGFCGPTEGICVPIPTPQ